MLYWSSSAEPEVVTEACGKMCSSYKAEMAVIHDVFKTLQVNVLQHDNFNIWLFTDFRVCIIKKCEQTQLKMQFGLSSQQSAKYIT